MNDKSFNFKYIKLKGKIKGTLSRRVPLISYSISYGIKWGIKFSRSKNDREIWLQNCYDLLMEKFSDFINEYRFEESDSAGGNIIWVSWLQNDQEPPEVVKLCIQSIKKNAPLGCNVNMVTLDNIAEYIELPEFIYYKLRKGNLTLTHFSDILRMALLRQYGGLWIDSTVYVCHPIPLKYVQSYLYSIQTSNFRENNYKQCYGPLTSFLIGGHTDCMIFDFCYKFFVEYQKKYNMLVDGHLINVVYRIIYENFPEVRESINEIGINNNKYNILVNYVDQIFDEEEWEKLTDNQIFHKLNWRLTYHETQNEEETFWGYIKRKILVEKNN